jgi:uracil phosphoribosyltransferase
MAHPTRVSRESVLAAKNLHVSRHPLVQDKLTRLREAARSPETFRILVGQVTALLLYEALADLKVGPQVVQTPLAPCEGSVLADQVGFIPVLRAGLGMIPAALEHVPNAQVWCLGMYRDEDSLVPMPYYDKMPERPTADLYCVLDIMLATGGSACDAIQRGARYGKPMKLISLIAAPEGVARVAAEHPDTQVYVGVLDDHLNDHGYIVPGLGDAGDRYFNTPVA